MCVWVRIHSSLSFISEFYLYNTFNTLYYKNVFHCLQVIKILTWWKFEQELLRDYFLLTAAINHVISLNKLKDRLVGKSRTNN